MAVLCGIALAWSMAMLDISEVSIPLSGSASMSLKTLPVVFGAMIIYQMIICTLEYIMQPVDIRRWKPAQADFRMTVILCTLSLYLLAWSFVSRSAVSAMRVLGGGIICLVAFMLLACIVAMITIGTIFWVHRSRYKRPPSVAPTCMKAMLMSLVISVPVFVGAIIWKGPTILTMGCKFLGLVEPPSATGMWLFLLTLIVLVLGYLLVEFIVLDSIFAWEPKPVFMPGDKMAMPELVLVTEETNKKLTTGASSKENRD